MAINTDTEIKIRVENIIVERTESDMREAKHPSLPAQKLNITKEKAFSGSSLAKSMAVQYAKQAASFALSNYGNLTGDYITQQNIQAGLELASMAIGIAVNPTIGIAAAGFNIGTRIASYATNNYKASLIAERLRERTGVITMSGGR